ncbi:hypothetical protein HRbin07_00447 [bacterium HR07]|nr:hypothetical protein HRbin07_00447 [bacterium HR07]
MHLPPDAVPDKVRDHRQPVTVHIVLNRVRDITHAIPSARRFYALPQGLFGHAHHARLRWGARGILNDNSRSQVRAKPPTHHADVYREHIAGLENPIGSRDAMHDLGVERRADIRRIDESSHAIPFERRAPAGLDDQAFGEPVQVQRRDARTGLAHYVL